MNKEILIDTNLIIVYFIKNSKLHDKTLALLEGLVDKDSTLLITPYILNEVHYFFLKYYSIDVANEICLDLHKSTQFIYTEINLNEKDLKAIYRLSKNYNLKTFDAYHAYSCKKIGTKHIATLDKDFNKVPWIEVTGF